MLPSGLRLIVEPERGTGHVEVVLVVSAGQATDPAGREGLAHLFEHLVFEAHPPGGPSRMDALDRLGVQSLNGSTGNATVRYHATAPRTQLAALVALHADMLVQPLAGITADDVVRERAIVLTELESQGPEYLASWMAPWLIDPSVPIAARPRATSASLAAVTLTDLQAFGAAYHRPHRATLLVVGDVDVLAARAEVWRALPAVLRTRGTPRPAAAPIVALPEPKALTALETVPGRVTRETLVVGWTLPSTVPRWLVAQTVARFRTEPQFEAASWTASDDVSLITCAVPRDPSLSAIDQLRELATRAHATTLTTGPIFLPGTFHLMHHDRWEARGRDRAVRTQVSGDAQLPFEGLQADHDAPGLARAVDAAVAPWRARGVVVRPAPAASVPLPDAPEPELSPLPDAAEDLARIAAVPDLDGVTALHLANGLPVVFVPRPDARLATVVLVRPGGHTRGRPGLARLVEEALGNEVGCLGRSGVGVEADDTTFWISGPKDALDCMFRHAALQATRPVDPRKFEQTKRLLLGNHGVEKPSPIAARLFGAAQAYWNPSRAELAALTLADAEAYRSAVADPARSALVVVGAADPARALALAQGAFIGWTAGTAAPAVIPAPLEVKPHPPHVTVVPRATKDVVDVSLDCLVPPAPLPNAVARLTRAVLDERVWRARRRLSSTYAVGAAHSGSAFAGHITVGATVHPQRLGPTLKYLKDALTAAPSAAELARARWAIAHRTRWRQADDAPEVGQWLGQLMVTGVPFERLRDANAAIVRVPDVELKAAWTQCMGAQQWMMEGDEALARAAAAAVFGEEALK